MELPFGPVDVAGIHSGAAWLRSQVHAAVVDLATAEVRFRLELPAGARFDHRIRFSGRLAAATIGQGEVVCVDVSSGKMAWRWTGEVRAATEGGFLVAARPTPEEAALIEVATDGTGREILRVPFERVLPPAVVAGGRLWTVGGGKLIGVPFGKKRWFGRAARPIEIPVAGAPALLPWRGGLLVGLGEEGRDGPITRLSALDGDRERLRDLRTVAGEIFSPLSAVGDDVLLAVASREGDAWDCRAVALDDTEPPLLLAVPRHARAAARDSIAAIAQDGALALFRTDRGHLRCVRVPLPPGGASVAVGSGVACAAHGQKLFVVEVGALDFGDGVAERGLDLAMVRRPSTADPQPAAVVFAGSAVVLVAHPRFGRLKLDRGPSSPVVEPGEHVLLDGVREEQPGIWKVDSWRKEGAAAAAPGAEGRLTLGPEGLPPIYPVSVAPPRESLANLHRASERLGFVIPPLLEKVVAEHDRDEAFRRWMERLGLIVEVTGYSIAWEGADPCMLSFAGDGGGDIHALYFYPPAHAGGGMLPVVDWWHETNEVSWIAADFDGYFAHVLHAARGDTAGVVERVLERLGLPLGFPQPRAGGLPDWFLAAHAPDLPPLSLDEVAARAAADPVRTERELVRLLRADADEERARSLLGETYRRLGWTWHAENLTRAGG